MPVNPNIVDFRNSWPVDPNTGQHYPPPDYFKNSHKGNRSIEEDGGELSRYETVNSIDKDYPSVELAEVETNEDHVLGSTNLLDKDGNIRLIPVSHTSVRKASTFSDLPVDRLQRLTHEVLRPRDLNRSPVWTLSLLM